MSLPEQYTKFADVPKEFTKTITGGTLKGMTDIKPQWRYQALTELYGMVGKGWFPELVKQEIIDLPEGEKMVSVLIRLIINEENPILSFGGSMLVSKTKHGLKANDEAFKMALTDAISTACAKLGIGSNIYLGQDSVSKYNNITIPADSIPESAKTPSKVLNGNQTLEDYFQSFQYLEKGGWINITKKDGSLSVNGERIVRDIESGNIVIGSYEDISKAGYKMSKKDFEIISSKKPLPTEDKMKVAEKVLGMEPEQPKDFQQELINNDDNLPF